jgi:DNA-binding NtrC family response regulator
MSAKKIVIIDDDPEICDAMSHILSQNGYQVFTALDTRPYSSFLLGRRWKMGMAERWMRIWTGFMRISSWKNPSSQKNLSIM